MTTVLLASIIWGLLALPTAVIIGRAIRLADKREGRR